MSVALRLRVGRPSHARLINFVLHTQDRGAFTFHKVLALSQTLVSRIQLGNNITDSTGIVSFTVATGRCPDLASCFFRNPRTIITTYTSPPSDTLPSHTLLLPLPSLRFSPSPPFPPLAS